MSALPSASVYSGEGYAVILVDCGSCPAAAVANLISDTCGYTDTDAMRLASIAPRNGFADERAVSKHFFPNKDGTRLYQAGWNPVPNFVSFFFVG